jgi:hypothetical protein
VLAKTRYSGPVTEPEAETGTGSSRSGQPPSKTGRSPSCATSPKSAACSTSRPSS